MQIRDGISEHDIKDTFCNCYLHSHNLKRVGIIYCTLNKDAGFTDLRVSRISVANEAFIVRWRCVWGDIKRLVKELKVGDIMTDVNLLAHYLRVRLPPDEKKKATNCVMNEPTAREKGTLLCYGKKSFYFDVV